MKVVQFPGRGRPKGTKSTSYTKYPWDKWFDGNTWQATQGEDFTVPVESFRIMTRAAAARQDMFCETSIQGNDVFFRAFPLDEL